MSPTKRQKNKPLICFEKSVFPIQNNAFTGAGKEAFGNRTRLRQPSLGATDSAAECVAKLSLDTPERVLGLGNLQSIFPDSLDDIYDIGDSYSDELACRVML